ncbi:MAG: hypothetical protein JSS66_15845 [Armatimonadetes bacterium]|nr:hypothetical protein [Armatimonadota bacterium]
MKTPITILAGTIALGAVVLVLTQPATSQVQGQQPGYVRLQTTTPGTAQAGHANVTGTVRAGSFVGGGGGLTGLSASNISQGTLGQARLPGNVAFTNANNDFTGTNSFDGFVGVGRSTKLNTNDFFEVKGTNSLYNGIGIEGPAGSKPFYGYAAGGSVNCWSEYDGTNQKWNLFCDSGWITWTGTNFGIGTLDPKAALDVHEGTIAVTNSIGTRQFRANIDGASGAANVIATGPNGSTNCYFGATSFNPNYGQLAVCSDNGTTKAYLFVDNNLNGVVVGNIKSFREVNPRDASEDIFYASIEGPEAAEYVRGTGHLVNGRAHIQLPQHFADMASPNGITVVLTPKDPGSKGLGYWHGTPTGFDAFEINNGTGSYEFDWEVKAVRKGYEDFKVVRSWEESLPAGTDRKAAWTARLQSIADRQALLSHRQPTSRP